MEVLSSDQGIGFLDSNPNDITTAYPSERLFTFIGLVPNSLNFESWQAYPSKRQVFQIPALDK